MAKVGKTAKKTVAVGKKKVILLVDDDADFVESNKDLLEAQGYAVLAANNGAAGLALAKKEKPQLMILDVMMATETEGFEISRAIPESPELKNMAVLLVTGIKSAMKLPYGFEPDSTWLPVKEVLEKPVPPRVLLDHVKRALA